MEATVNKNGREEKMNEVYEFLKTAGIYYLATIDGAQPRVRPFGTVDLFEGKLYIQTGKSKSVSAQMKINPNIEISAMHNDKWIRITAKAVFEDNVAAQAHLLENYPTLQGKYRPGDGNTEVFYLKDVNASISSFTEPSKEISF